MNIHKKLLKSTTACTGTGKTCLKFVEPKSFFPKSCLSCSILMEKTAGAFLSLFTGNVLTFWISLYQPFSNLRWHFPYCKYLAATLVRIWTLFTQWAFQTLDLAFGFLWRLQNLNRFFGWVLESLGRLFWKKCLAEFLGHRETFGIFENLVCQKAYI